MGFFDFLDPIRHVVEEWVISIGVTVPPWSGLFLVLISLLLSSFTGFLNRTLLDMDELEEKTAEMKELNDMKKKAMETADKKLWIKFKRNEDRMLELQKSMMISRMAPSLITILPFFFIFSTLRAAFQQTANFALNEYCKTGYYDGGCVVNEGRHGAIVVLPFKMHHLPLLGRWFSPFSHNTGISVAGFSFWYFLSAITISTMFQRLLGINITGMQTPGSGGMGR